jgi:hypothetical protein
MSSMATLAALAWACSISLSLSLRVSLYLLSHIIGWGLDISRCNIRSATEILMCSSSVFHWLLGWRHHITMKLESNNLNRLTIGYIRKWRTPGCLNELLFSRVAWEKHTLLEKNKLVHSPNTTYIYKKNFFNQNCIL